MFGLGDSLGDGFLGCLCIVNAYLLAQGCVCARVRARASVSVRARRVSVPFETKLGDSVHGVDTVDGVLRKVVFHEIDELVDGVFEEVVFQRNHKAVVRNFNSNVIQTAITTFPKKGLRAPSFTAASSAHPPASPAPSPSSPPPRCGRTLPRL